MTQETRESQQTVNGQKSSPRASEGCATALQRRFPLLATFLAAPPTWLWCLLIGAIALGFNLYRLGVPSIWFDESFSVELSRQPVALIWRVIWGPQPNMQLYYLFLHYWLSTTALLGFHDTEFIVRLPSAIFAALGSVVVFLLGRRFLGLAAGVVAALLYLANDLQLVYAQQTRSYSLQVLLLCIAWYALFAALTSEKRQKSWWACYAAAMALAMYTQVFSVLILLSQIVALAGLIIFSSAWRATIVRQWAVMTGAFVAIGALSAPGLLAGRNVPVTGWLPIPHLRDVVGLLLIISGGNKYYLVLIAALCLLGFVVALLSSRRAGADALPSLLLVRKPDGERITYLQRCLPVVWGIACWLIVPIMVSYVVSQGQTRLFSTRYLVTIVPPLFLLVGMGVAVLRWRLAQVALAALLVAIALLAVPQYYRSAQVEDWNAATYWLEQHYQSNDGLVCYDNVQGCQIAVEYYLHAYPSAAHFTSDSPGYFSWEKYNFGDAEQALDTHALATFGANHPQLFFIIGRVPDSASAARVAHTRAWLDSHFQFLSQIVTPTVTIRLYDTSSAIPF